MLRDWVPVARVCAALQISQSGKPVRCSAESLPDPFPYRFAQGGITVALGSTHEDG